MYAGNVGFSQSLDLLVAAARALQGRPERRVRGQRRRLGPPRSGGRAAGLGQRPLRRPTSPRSAWPRCWPRGDIHVVPLQAGPGRARACRRRRTRSWPPAGRCWPASTRAPRWPGSSSGPAAAWPCPRTTRRRLHRPRCADLPRRPGRAGGHGRAGPGLRRAVGVAGGRGRRPTRRLFAELGQRRGARRFAPCSPVASSSSWARHRRPRRSLGSPRPAGAARSARSRASSSRSRSSSSLMLGLALICLRPCDQPPGPRGAGADTNTQPGDHWHAAYGIYICDQFLPTKSVGVTPRPGRHPHPRDGVIHIHPFQTGDDRPERQARQVLQPTGLNVTTSKIELPTDSALGANSGKTYKNGDKCPDGKTGSRSRPLVWDDAAGTAARRRSS